jgi:tetratricopeptide (TPR) repeat protein
MVGELAQRHALSEAMIDDVNERTGGVPLFVEEVTRLLLERGEQGGAHAIPPTLQQFLAARLDRLGEAREAAQIGAVLGRGFSYALLCEVGGLAEASLQTSLERLAEADLLFVEGAPPLATYRFKHALIQDAAYESLLKSRRQPLHRRAAEILREAAAEPEAIAHHFTEAGLDDLAIEWWGKAGDQALRRSAFQEAISHLGKAIAMADKAGGASTPRGAGDAAVASRRVKLQADYGRAVMWSKGLAADETKAALDRVHEIGPPAQDAAERFSNYYGRWAWSFLRGELRSARGTAETFLREAEAEGRATEANVACLVLGHTFFWQGKLLEARAHLERALRAPEHTEGSRFSFGTDSSVSAAAELALAVWHQGEIERVRLLIEQAIRNATESGHAATLVHALLLETLLVSHKHDANATLRAAETLVQLGREHRMDLHAATGEVFVSWARGRLGDPEYGARCMRKALETYIAQGNRLLVPHCHGLHAELEAETGAADVALRSIDQALAFVEETGEHVTDSFLHRLRGELLLGRDLADPARPRKPSRPPSPLRSSKARAATSCSRPLRSPSSTNQLAAPLKPTRSSPPRSKAFRPRRRCRRSPKRRR